MVLCARPVAALTAVTPPRPSEAASTAAQRRRPRSDNSAASAWYLVSIHRTMRCSIMRGIVTKPPLGSQRQFQAINYARCLRVGHRVHPYYAAWGRNRPAASKRKDLGVVDHERGTGDHTLASPGIRAITFSC